MGSNPGTVYWMDIFSHVFVLKIVLFVWKRPKINEKEAGVGPFKKLESKHSLKAMHVSSFAHMEFVLPWLDGFGIRHLLLKIDKQLHSPLSIHGSQGIWTATHSSKSYALSIARNGQ